MMIREDVVDITKTKAGKFQAIANDLNKYAPLLANMEAQFGQLGMVSRVEKLFERVIANKLGWNIKIISDIDSKYIVRILTSTIIPTIILSRKFSTDLIKAIKAGTAQTVINKLKEQLYDVVHSVRDKGIEPFDEKYSYIVVEASTADGSFQAALPVNAISLVDTEDADQAYVAQELKKKKNHFILKPTSEQIKSHLVEYCKSTPNLYRYLKIVENSNIEIIKEHVRENNNTKYNQLGNNIILSKITI